MTGLSFLKVGFQRIYYWGFLRRLSRGFQHTKSYYSRQCTSSQAEKQERITYLFVRSLVWTVCEPSTIFTSWQLLCMLHKLHCFYLYSSKLGASWTLQNPPVPENKMSPPTPNPQMTQNTQYYRGCTSTYTRWRWVHTWGFPSGQHGVERWSHCCWWWWCQLGAPVAMPACRLSSCWWHRVVEHLLLNPEHIQIQ